MSACFRSKLAACRAACLFCVLPGLAGACEIDTLVARAFSASPGLSAAARRVEQARARADGVRLEFYDPALSVSGGRSGVSRGIPGSSAVFILPDNAAALQAAVDVPAPPGLYFSIGAAERYFTERANGDPAMYQTLVGAQIRVPLLRDRGFRQWKARCGASAADYAAAQAEWLASAQETALDVERAYIAAIESEAALAVARDAAERSRLLLREAEKLVALSVIPEYQVFPVEMALELRMTEETQAAQARRVALLRLGAAVGSETPVEPEAGGDWLMTEAETSDLPPLPEVQAAAGRRGLYLALVSGALSAQRRAERALDDLRSDVSLNAGATWQGENTDGPFGNELVTSDRNFGAEVSLIWRRPLGFAGEEKQVAESRALLAEFDERLAAARLRVATELKTAHSEWEAAQRQLAGATRALAAARKTLDAEQERFLMGDARSRNVTDAQADLTAAMNRANRIAAAMLRARADYYYACGETRGLERLWP